MISISKKYFLLSFLILTLQLLNHCTAKENPNGMTLDRVEIYSVSTDTQKLNDIPKGSINGGTMVHLRAKGHNITPSKNKIFIGPYPCIIHEKGISGNKISCWTTPQTIPDQYWQLPIVLHVENKVQSKCQSETGKCVFTYNRSYTPYLRWIVPGVATPNTMINWNAYWRVSRSSEVTKMVIGGENCNRYELQDPEVRQTPTNLNYDEDMKSIHSTQILNCQTSEEQAAGIYDVSIESRFGNLYKYPSSTYVTADGQKEYDFVVTADIKEISSNVGSEQGNRLEITGLGFGKNITDVQVKVGSQDCEITELNNKRIVCELGAGTQPSESAGQFIHGQGVLYTEYDLKASEENQSPGYEETHIHNVEDFKDAVQNGSLGNERIRIQSIIGSWESEFPERIGVHMKGYFKAPRTGNYKFWVSCDDSAQIYLNTNELTDSVQDSDKIVEKSLYSYQRNYLLPNGFTQIQNEGQELEEGKLYWMEVFSVNGSGSGHLTVSVEAPALSDGSYAANSLSEMQYFRIVPNKDNEKWHFKVFNQEKYNVFTEYTKDRKHTINGFLNNNNEGIIWDSLDDDGFVDKISRVFGYDPVLIESYDLDSEGNRCSGDCDVQGMEIVFEFQDFRDPEEEENVKLQCWNCQIERVKEQSSSPLSGTFTMQLTWESKGQERTEFVEVWKSGVGRVRDIPFDTPGYEILSGLITLDSRFNSIQVRDEKKGVDGKYYEFHFTSDDVSLKGDIQNFVVDVSNIQGGKGSHSVDQGEKITASKNLFHEPIPFDMSFVKADKPSVLVTVNQVLSRCSGDCTYQTSPESTPQLTTFSETSKTLTLGITVPAGLTIPVSDLEITFGNYPCDASSGGSDISNFTCTVEGIEAGDHLPKIYAKGVGYIKHSSSLSPLNQGIALSGLSPASGSINGGKEVTITGTGGFPKTENIDNLVVKFGDVVAHVKSTSDTSIVVDIPSSQTGTGDVDVTVEYNNKTSDSQSFTYSDTGVPTITSIEINSVVTNFGSKAEVNPVKKQTIKIVGTNFEDEKTSVWLLNKETDRPVYDVNVNSVNSDGTEITATLSGGKVGEYNLIVSHSENGNSVQKIEFDYIIKITNIDLTQGPKQGGPKITITGVNFGAQKADNQVFFEQQEGIINSQAIIESCTTSEIVARIPKMPTDANINENFTITVFGRIIEKGTCKDTTNNCQFTYQEGLQVPYLTESQFKEVKNGDSVQFKGEHLPIAESSDSAKLIIKGIQDPLPLTFDSESKFAAFKIPNTIPAGQYLTQVKLESYGVIGAFLLDVQLEIGQILPSQGINIGGGEITIQGSGFSQYSKFLIDNKECVVKSFSSNEITCIAPPKFNFDESELASIIVEEPSRDSEACNSCLLYFNSNEMVVESTTPASNEAELVVIPEGNFVFKAILIQEPTEAIFVYFQATENPLIRLEADNIVINEKEVTATFNEVIAGTYEVQVEIEGKGFATITPCEDDGCIGPAQKIVFGLAPLTISSGGETGLAGGTQMVLSGKGFNSIDVFMNEISVCGHVCEIQEDLVSNSSISCLLPRVNTRFVFDEDYEEGKRRSNLKRDGQRILLDKFLQKENRKEPRLFKKITTSETGSVNIINQILERAVGQVDTTSNEFSIEFETRQNTKAFIEKIVLDPGNDYNMENYFGKVKLQGRNAVDDAWVDLDTFTSDHLSDYQELTLKVEDTSVNAQENRKTFIQSKVFKYFRIVETQEINQKAFCQLFIKKINGVPFYEQDIAGDEDFTCEVITYVNDQFAGIQGDSTVAYKGSVATARVTDISPQFSTRIGSDQITISGSNFGTDSSTIKVFVDGQECNIDSVADGQIVFTTPSSIVPVAGAKPIEVTLNDKPVLMKKGVLFFSGALRWSHESTWGGESLPRDKHFAVVPKGETLVVDMSTPILNTLLVEGTVLFDSSLNLDIEVKAEYIIVREGQFIAGTETKPYTEKLTITLYGNYWGKQLPDFGNKVLACHNCQIDIHAAKKGPHFALLKETATVGATTLKLAQEVDWEVEDFIGIATTDFKGEHSEKVQIKSITSTVGSGETTIEFTPSLQYSHIAEEETFGSRTLKNQAEVILLSSNIKIRGDPEDSERDQYGGHFVVHGKSSDGTVARIDGVEFFNTGQPSIVGRYTCHFHMLGDSPNSYVRNIKVHNAFARVVAIHATNYLRVQNNVGFKVPGHNIFLEDGVETNNIIEGNVLISPRSAFTMLQTDVTVAGIWITNPSNTVRYNIIAGSQFYGMWYEIMQRPASRTELCPEGMPILQLEHNIGHSNERFGLRFFRLQPRMFPCRYLKDKTKENPFEDNPSIQYTYRNQTSWKNGESGILAEFMGDSIFEDRIMADNFRTGFQSHIANFTENPVLLRDSLIVGKTDMNGEVVDYESSAILVPRSQGFKADNVDIYNMPEGTNIIESSSENQFKLLWTTGGHQNDLNNLNIQNSDNAKKLKWQGPRANLIFDEDGSLTGKNVPTWITPYKTHFDKPIADGLCERNQELYDDSVLCSIPLRSLKFGNMVQNSQFVAAKLKIFNLNDETKTEDIQESDERNYGQYLQYLIKNKEKDMLNGFASVLPVGYVFNIHWNKGIEWDHTLIYPSYLTEETDKNIILRFPYWEQRELFEVFRMVTEKLVKVYNQKSDLNQFIDPVTDKTYEGDDKCSNGDWIQDDENKFFYLCISGKGRDGIKYQQIDVNAVYCRDSCDTGGFSCERETSFKPLFPSSDEAKQKTFIDESQGAKAMAKSPGSNEWEFREPQEGDDVRIPCEFMMTFNVPSFRFNNLYIDGVLRIDPDIPKTTIYARNIWIRGGKLAAGSESQVFDKEFEIILEGDRLGESLVIDDISQTGTKSIAVTGRIELYGITPSTTQTRLSAIVNPGDTQIQVYDDISEWNVGDKLVLGANKREGTGFETVEIQSKDDATKTITLTTAVEHWHYVHQHVTVGTTDDSEIKIDAKYGGDLDMRGTVGHITRNIKIRGNKEETNWGGHLQFYHYKLEDEKLGLNINARGNGYIQGVEFDNMGQRDTENAGIHFFMTKEDSTEFHETTIIGSSIHNCNGMCINGKDSSFVTFENNVISKGIRFLIQVLDSKRWTITNNLLIGVLKRDVEDVQKTGIWDPTAIIHMYTPYTPQEDDHNVYNNVAQGSEGIGFAFPGTPCEFKDDNRFKNNEVGHCAFSGILFNMKYNECYHIGYQGVYNAVDGITLNTKNSDDGYQAEQFRVAECGTNIILHTGSNARIHNNFVKKSWVSALARPSCTECYTEQRLQNNESRCSNGNGFQLHVTTVGGESFPWEKSPFIYDVICGNSNAFQSVMMDEIELHNYRDVYSDSYLEECSGNRGLRNHGSAASATASHYLRDVKCTDCEKAGLIHIMEPKEAWRGWFGGCGTFDCTGLKNILIQDLTGHFLGHIGSIIPNNQAITSDSEYFSLQCTHYEKWNAYDCTTTELGVLEWAALSSDNQELSPVPVYVANDHFNNTINMWREWEWQGPEPLNKRMNRYVSLVAMNQVHNITYSGTKCSDIVHKLAQRSQEGENNRFIVVNYHYDSPLALEVTVNDEIVKPWPVNDQRDLVEHNRTDCGANNYYYQNNTIHFVITNEANCHVRVYQKNFLQVNLRIKMTPEQFYSEPERVGHFQNLLASFLGVDYSQIRIVGLKSFRRLLQEGESELKFIILGDQPGNPDDGYKPKESYVKLRDFGKKIEEGITQNTLELGYESSFSQYEVKVVKKIGIQATDDSGLMTEEDLIDPDTGNIGNDPNTTKETEEENDSIIPIILGIIFGVIGAVVIALVVYHFWKKSQQKGISNISQQQDQNSMNEKGVNINRIHHSEQNHNVLELNDSSQK